jgi:hypothetical protein
MLCSLYSLVFEASSRVVVNNRSHRYRHERELNHGCRPACVSSSVECLWPNRGRRRFVEAQDAREGTSQTQGLHLRVRSVVRGAAARSGALSTQCLSRRSSTRTRRSFKGQLGSWKWTSSQRAPLHLGNSQGLAPLCVSQHAPPPTCCDPPRRLGIDRLLL